MASEEEAEQPVERQYTIHELKRQLAYSETMYDRLTARNRKAERLRHAKILKLRYDIAQYYVEQDAAEDEEEATDD